MVTLSKIKKYRSGFSIVAARLRQYWPELSVVALVIFLHLYRVAGLFYFGIDEEYQSLLGWAQVKDFHPIWIGLSAANTGFYLGPGLVYWHALLLWLSHGDPVVLAYAAALTGIVTITVFYLVGRDLFSRRVALIATALYGLSAFIVQYDRRFWNSTCVPLAAILIYWTLVKIEKHPRFLLLLAFLAGAILHIHASLFLFLPLLVFFALKTVIRHRPPILLMLASAFVFLLVYSPLLVFDFSHHFDNWKVPFHLLGQTGQTAITTTIRQHASVFVSTLSHYWIMDVANPFQQLVLTSVSVLTLLIWSTKRKNLAQRYLTVVVLLYILMFFFFPGTILDYYYLGFFPFLALVFADLLQVTPGKILAGLLAVICFNQVLTVLSWPTNQGLSAKKRFVVATSRAIAGRAFYLDTRQPYLYDGGWRYLFMVYGQRPAQSRADTMFGWIYPDEIAKQPPRLKVVITTDAHGRFRSIIAPYE
ncbi:glycosyltransferase family 39 protein [Patescibacteria group bacterium]|nr:glycosyltransferase family 39 protein [Patescibacteria group bacterium]